MTEAKVYLRKDREGPILYGHPWIFSGAIEKMEEISPGDIAQVYSYSGQLLGIGYVNPTSSITVRMLSAFDKPIEEILRERLTDAHALRKNTLDLETTSSYRLINGEGDGLPGVIVDRYDHVFVLQIGSLGMERLKGILVSLLVEMFSPSGVYEKSSSPSRKKEGLKPSIGWLYGNSSSLIPIQEDGIRYEVDIEEGQKTGFFLDQREMRKKIRYLAKDKNVLNCFAYSGGFSVNALMGGAKHVDSVEISAKASAWMERNVSLNINTSAHSIYTEDVFSFLENTQSSYDLIVLDPPAFAKKRNDTIAALRGYEQINRLAMRKMQKGGLLLTCSCSHFIEEDKFKDMLFSSAIAEKKSVRILSRHILSLDHPVMLVHPEGEYLKSFLLSVDDFS